MVSDNFSRNFKISVDSLHRIGRNERMEMDLYELPISSVSLADVDQ